VEGDSKNSRPVTAQRQKILDKAFAQLRKARGEMDPKLLSKIRRMIAGSPEMMKSLGVTETLAPAPAAPLKAAPVVAKNSPVKREEKVSGTEKVDQAKNMEIMAKLMALSPDNREQIKSVIKKAEK
jgi:hypothetical protein